MAYLSSKYVSLEIRFVELDDQNWVQYEILFLYQGQPMVADALLKRVNAHWQKRSTGAFKANDFEYDTLVRTLNGVLDNNQPDYWEPSDPDVTLAIYPETIFPGLPSHMELVWESEESQRDREAWEQEKTLQGPLPCDPMTVICLVDAYNFGDTRGYQGDGLALVMVVTRQELEDFRDELRREYALFCETWGMRK